MADIADLAHEAEELHREHALQARQRRAMDMSGPINALRSTECIDCAEQIDPARWTAMRGCTARCVDCANIHEEHLRHGR